MTFNDMPIVKILMSDIVKFFLATIVLLLGFLWKGERVGETQDATFFQDYLSIQDTGDQTDEEETHESAPVIQDKCSIQDQLCEKIQARETEEIVPYKNQVYTSAYFINDNQILKKKIVDAIKKIEIKDDETEKR